MIQRYDQSSSLLLSSRRIFGATRTASSKSSGTTTSEIGQGVHRLWRPNWKVRTADLKLHRWRSSWSTLCLAYYLPVIQKLLKCQCLIVFALQIAKTLPGASVLFTQTCHFSHMHCREICWYCTAGSWCWQVRISQFTKILFCRSQAGRNLLHTNLVLSILQVSMPSLKYFPSLHAEAGLDMPNFYPD